MLRLLAVIKGDIRFQWKYGFYYMYLFLMILYLGILSLLSGSGKEIVGHIMVYSDPAAMGMFFMGAIVLLEKSQRVLNSIAVSPVSPMEYIGGKMCSIGIISLLVGMVLLIPVGMEHIVLAVWSIVSASFVFTLCGIIVGTKIHSLTGYIVGTLPFEIAGFLPPIAKRLGWAGDSAWILLHPGCAQMQLLEGNTQYLAVSLISTVAWVIILLFAAKHCVTKMFQSVGGGNES
ncbi:MAG: ABC transporter permease [Lachnospiraceae bacterium]|nr:ABC transporter permease [Lachnospiraceae bacterium]